MQHEKANGQKKKRMSFRLLQVLTVFWQDQLRDEREE